MGTQFPLLALFLIFAVVGCIAAPETERSAFVDGAAECKDCAEKNIKNEVVFKGLQVVIRCKDSKGDYKIKGVARLDKNGNFNVPLSRYVVQHELEEKCMAELQTATRSPCSSEESPSKIILKSREDGKHGFSVNGKLPFSSATCSAAFWWPPNWHPFHKYLPPYTSPPKPSSPSPPKPYFPPYTKPEPTPPPPTTVYKPPVPVNKPPIPIYKPPVYKPPMKKPCPPPVPVYKPPVKKLCPPPVPLYKPPVYEKPIPPPTPIYKEPLPPLPEFPPIYKKPLPPLPEFPPSYKKPFPQIPFYPKVGWPPLPPNDFHHP